LPHFPAPLTQAFCHGLLTFGDGPLVKEMLRLSPNDLCYEAMLTAAVGFGFDEVLRVLLQDKRADPTKCSPPSLIMDLAITDESGTECLRTLLADGRLEPTTADLNTALRTGVNDDAAMLLLHDGRAQPDADSLYLAVLNEHDKAVEHLLCSKNMKPGTLDLDTAVGYGRVDLLKLLLSKVGDADAAINWPKLLATAVTLGDEDKEKEEALVQLLLKHHPPSPLVLPRDLWPHVVCNVNILRAILNDGRADPSAYDNHALYFACATDCIEAVKLLVADRRVDPVPMLQACVEWAMEYQKPDIVACIEAMVSVRPEVKNRVSRPSEWPVEWKWPLSEKL